MQKSESIMILEYWNILRRHMLWIILFVAVSSVGAAIYSLMVTEIYRAEVRINPIGSGGDSMMSGIASQFGGLAGLVKGGGQSSTQQLLAILDSRTVAEEVIERFDLLSVILGEGNAGPERRMEDAVKKLTGSMVSASENMKYGTVDIKVRWSDPVLARDIANAYVDILGNNLQSKSYTAAKRNRIFLEKQLVAYKQRLMLAGKRLNNFYKTGERMPRDATVDVPVVSDFLVDASASDTESVRRLQDTIDQVKHMSASTGARGQAGHVLQGVPQQVYLDYLALQRKMLEQINRLLSEQYVMAQIKESQEELSFEIVDSARTPTRHVEPRRRIIVMAAFALSLFSAIAFVFIRAAWRELVAREPER